MSATPVVSAAFTLAEEYGLPVLPCRSHDLTINGKLYKAKSPLTPHGFKDASTNLAQIEEWWQRWPDALIGVPTGRVTKMLVIDIDPAGLEWYRQNASRFSAGRIHKTRRDGFHLLYRMPVDVEIGNSTSQLAPGVDVRGIGGYVVWWPAHGCEPTGDMEDLAEPPQWLIEAILAAQKNPKAAAPGNGHDAGRVHEGGRNDRLSREAFRQRKLGSTVEQILIVLRALNEANCVPPLDEAEVRQIAEGKARVTTGNNGEPDAPPEPYLLTWFESLGDVVQKPYVVKGLMLTGSLVVVFGESNSGKTFLMLDTALAAAQGIPWRGRLTHRTLVIYVAGESANSVRTRVAAYRKKHPELTHLPFAVLGHSVNFLDPGSVNTLIATINAAKAEHETTEVLVIVDTFARAIPGGNENDSQDVGMAVMAADTIRAATGACVAFVHHTGKDPAKGARGSSALRAAADTEILVEGTIGDSRIATVTKQRDLQSGQRMVFELEVVDLADDPEEPGRKITSCVVRHKGEDDLPATPAMRELRGKNQRLLVAALRARAKADPERIWTLPELRAAGAEIGLSKWTASRAVDAVISAGYMQPCVGGNRFTDGVHLGANGCNAP